MRELQEVAKPQPRAFQPADERANLPGHLGAVITDVNGREVRAMLPIEPARLAPCGYLHAGSVVTLADTAAGVGCVAYLPESAVG